MARQTTVKARKGGNMPKWATPDRQAHLVKLWLDYGNQCLYGHKACLNPNHYLYTEPKGVTKPVPVKLPCRDTEGNPILDKDGNQLYLTVYGTKTETVYKPKVARLYDLKSEQAIKAWIADDRTQSQAEWQAERKALHSLAERRYPLRGQFSTISKDIFFGNQPQFYIEGIGISGLTFQPFAKVRLASSYMRLHIYLADSLKGLGKNARRKALRYGRLSDTAYRQISLAVKHYLDH